MVVKIIPLKSNFMCNCKGSKIKIRKIKIKTKNNRPQNKSQY